MSEHARKRIFERLRSVPHPVQDAPPQAGGQPPSAAPPSRGEMTERLKRLMEAMRAEVHVAPAAGWTEALKRLLRGRGHTTLVYGPESTLGRAVEAAWREDAEGLPELVAYTAPVEDFKQRLFTANAGITSAAGAVAETGAILLAPDAAEPRLISLVPPVHIAVLHARDIVFSLADAMRIGRWADDMPANMLLISGPSKTADIELTLAFGVHGPKEVIVMVLE